MVHRDVMHSVRWGDVVRAVESQPGQSGLAASEARVARALHSKLQSTPSSVSSTRSGWNFWSPMAAHGFLVGSVAMIVFVVAAIVMMGRGRSPLSPVEVSSDARPKVLADVSVAGPQIPVSELTLGAPRVSEPGESGNELATPGEPGRAADDSAVVGSISVSSATRSALRSESGLDASRGTSLAALSSRTALAGVRLHREGEVVRLDWSGSRSATYRVTKCWQRPDFEACQDDVVTNQTHWEDRSSGFPSMIESYRVTTVSMAAPRTGAAGEARERLARDSRKG